MCTTTKEGEANHVFAVVLIGSYPPSSPSKQSQSGLSSFPLTLLSLSFFFVYVPCLWKLTGERGKKPHNSTAKGVGFLQYTTFRP
jgi:hypothetical protein